MQLCCLKPAWGVFVCRQELTPEGLKYLLQPTPEQVWVLLRQYIQAAEQTSGALARLGFWFGGARVEHAKHWYMRSIVLLQLLACSHQHHSCCCLALAGWVTEW